MLGLRKTEKVTKRTLELSFQAHDGLQLRTASLSERLPPRPPLWEPAPRLLEEQARH